MCKKVTILLVVLVMLLVVFSGSALAYKFALVVHVAGTPFWVPVIKGAEEAGELLGIEVQFMGPEEFSVGKQVDYLESAIAQGFDGIGVAISDAEALDEPIAKAMKMGIPVVAFNIDDPYTPNERMAFEPGNAALEERCAGIEQIFVEHGIKSERFSAPLADPSTAVDMLKSYIRSHPNLKIVAASEFSSAFAGMAMKELGMKPGELLIAGFDLVLQLTSSLICRDSRP
jgi:simple sugar transport system substrate-binding protein